MRSVSLALTAIVLLAACEKHDPVANEADGAGLAAPENHGEPDAVGAPPGNEVEANAAGASSSVTIPAALRGRWGLTPADCTSARGDAKGLLTITATELRYYESRGTPGTDIQLNTTSMNGHFNFTGEGQSWSKFQSFKASGTKLVRTETNPAASFTYAKC